VRHLRVAFVSRLLPLALLVVLGGCSSEPLQTGGEGPQNGSASDADQAVAELVLGTVTDGTPAFVTIYDPTDNDSGRSFLPTALAWNPSQTDELWITLREPPSDQACVSTTKTGCPWLGGRVAVVQGAASAPGSSPQIEIKQDADAFHFMRATSSIAFGVDESVPGTSVVSPTFATCGEAWTGNYDDGDIPFIGPVLWAADPSIFAAPALADSPLGTHIDMLHESPYCVGIAHERDNVYWVFNGDAGSLDRYDFHAPHQPGGDDHSDGEVWRYAAGLLERVPQVPSHLAYDAETQRVYAADSGHGRIVALDTTSGTPGNEVTTYDPIATHVEMTGAALRTIVAEGRLGAPSGLVLYRDVLFVTDALTSRIIAFDLAGRTLAQLETGLPPGSLGGIAIGPDGRAYFADSSTARVLRVDPAQGP
jgi:sugar lactone lactonase YvrE